MRKTRPFRADFPYRSPVRAHADAPRAMNPDTPWPAPHWRAIIGLMSHERVHESFFPDLPRHEMPDWHGLWNLLAIQFGRVVRSAIKAEAAADAGAGITRPDCPFPSPDQRRGPSHPALAAVLGMAHAGTETDSRRAASAPLARGTRSGTAGYGNRDSARSRRNGRAEREAPWIERADV